MEALIEYFKKHKALAWIGVGVLAVAAYIIGKNMAAQPSATTTTPQPTGTFNYNYYQQQALQPATTGTTATPAPTPTDTTATTPILQFPTPQFPIVTTTHPAGIVDNSPSPAPHPTSSPRPTTYTIKAGDTLASIAAKFGLDANQLYNKNRGLLSQVSKQHKGYYYD